MKRIISCLLMIVLLLCGCGGSSDETPAQLPQDTAAESSKVEPPVAPPASVENQQQADVSAPEVNPLPSEAPVPPAAEPQPEVITYTVERDLLYQEIVSEDKVKLAVVRYQLPLLQARDAAGNPVAEGTTPERSRALEVMAAFNENFEPWRQEDEFLRQMVAEGYRERPEMFQMGMHYADELDFSVWQTERLISIRADSYSFYGGAHPNVMLLGWNFDLVSGTYIHMLSIGEDEQAFRTFVAEELTRQADERAAALQQEPTDLYWSDYRNILLNWHDYPVTFDENGMTVRFSAYELGSYAAGAHEFTIGYTELEPLLGELGRELLGLTKSAS